MKQVTTMMKVLVVLLITHISSQAQYQISLVAGKNPEGLSATEVPLNQPRGLVTDSQGNIYFVDESNFRIRKIEATTGKITTIAGTGEEGFSGDGNLAVKA